MPTMHHSTSKRKNNESFFDDFAFAQKRTKNATSVVGKSSSFVVVAKRAQVFS